MEDHQKEIKSTKKRVRASNWDEDEKKLLRQLIMDKVHIIERKDCTTNTNGQKKAAWQEILSNFNSLNSKQRDMTQIVTQWRNTKGQVKARESEYRRAKLMTGGGPPPPSPPSEDLELIQNFPNEFVVDCNNFDSDSIFIKSKKQSHATGTGVKNETEETLIPDENIIEPNKSVQLLDPADEEKELQLTPLASTSHAVIQNKNLKRKLYNPLKRKDKTIVDDYEHQLFLLAKKAQENKEQREEELHRKRMKIMDLEQEYWEKKLKNM